MPQIFHSAISRSVNGDTQSTSKRKRTEDGIGSDADATVGDTTNSADDSGRDTSLEPSSLFPHAPLVSRGQHHASTARRQHEESNLQRQHFEVVNAIMHKSLQEGQYARAGKAFGLMLRTQVPGERLDIRKNQLWGIGAEILLRTAGDPDAIDHKLFSSAGFRAAREFYDRLILQYPYQKLHPHVESAVLFYPAMFGLWLYEVQCEVKRARLDQDRPSSLEHDAVSEDLPRLSSDDRIARYEFEQATGIYDRLRQLAHQPPYDRDATLINMRGMVALWLADLTEDSGYGHVEPAEWRAKAYQCFEKTKRKGEPPPDVLARMRRATLAGQENVLIGST